MKKVFSFSAILIAMLAFNQLPAQKTFSILKTFHIASSGGWDYIAVGPGNNRLYVSHGTQVNILDETTGDSVGIIENTTGVHGIAFDKEHGKGFTSNGRINNVTVFDLKTNQVITQIPTGQNPDAIMYEPFTKKIITCNGRSQSLSILDPVENKLVDSVAVGGKPETAVSDGAGKVFVNIEDKSEIVEVDMKTLKVTNHWSIKPGDGPTGLSIDRKTNRLFAGCGNKKMVVVNAQTGAIVDTLPIGSRCDGTGIDINTRNVFASNGDGTLSVYHIASADKFELVAQVPTKTGARTIAVNDQKHLIYLPTAEFQSQAQNSGGRPQMIPGTFQVLVIGQ